MSTFISARFARALALVLALMVPFALTACGSKTETTTGANGETTTTKVEKSSKVEIAARLGAAYWVTNRYIIKPAKAGAFAKGAPKRKRAIAKATAAVAFDYRMITKAIEEAKKGGDTAILNKLTALIGSAGALASLKSLVGGGGGDGSGIGDLGEKIVGGLTGSGVDVKEEKPSIGDLGSLAGALL